MKIESSARTDMGILRLHNEDAFFCDPGRRVFVVADACGGSYSGDPAAALVVNVVPKVLEESHEIDERVLSAAVLRANHELVEMTAAQPRLRGTGTTIAMVAFANGFAFIAHVGDSRVYRFRNGALETMTEDHSLSRELLESGDLSLEEVDEFPHKNVITRAIGFSDSLEVETSRHSVVVGDVWLVCSDGLHKMVSEATISEILEAEGGLEETTDQLIVAANAGGGHDNITVVVCRVTE